MAFGLRRAHIVAVPYPAQGHIVPLMQLCKKLVREEGFMVTFVNTEHNHARMMQAQATKSDEEYIEKSKNIRLVGIPGGLPPELHGDPTHVVGAFKASEDLREPFEKLLDKLAHDGEPVTCIVSDVLMSWTQDSADKAGVPRVAFWTSSAAVYHVIWHMYGLISQGMPTFKAANAVFEDSNTEMVSCIPGLPPMDLNDLPIIVRSDPADFIYQFLSRQLQPMLRAAAVLLNTFSELEPDCLHALVANFPVRTYAIGPLLPPSATAVNGISPRPDGPAIGALLNNDKPEIVQDKPPLCTAVTATINHVPKAGSSPAVKAKEKASFTAAKKAATFSSAGIFSADVSCLQWLDKKESRSVLYISFGSIFAMSPEQFTELLEGLQASNQAFLWAIRPGFVQGWSSYTHLLHPSFLENIKGRGLLVSWVPQLSVLTHDAIGGFLTHCGWNSTIESVTLGVPMLCWPDVGERRTNGRLAVSLWEAGLEFSYSISSQTNSLLIERQEVKRVILLLMDPCSHASDRLRTNARLLQASARKALAEEGSSARAWNLFLKQITQEEAI
ncbi:hypothetical protein GOP47_0010030 [Adiantum capillus-veneris]|uniref:Glycosyltransferase n=1 Tax=Adiantum capillus-veneris TaxID=13818 RepID=A0A9D4ZHS8_ADICA|nr:hypothetical protein GOP47_0010030 [Adiantum capillus-veneris]